MDELVGYDDELVGYDIGDDDDDLDDFLGLAGDEIGAAPRSKKAVIRRMLAKKQRAGVYRAPHRPQRGRLLVFGGQAVATGTGAIDITTTIQEKCRVDRLFLAATDAAGAVVANGLFTVTDIKVGTKSQLTANAPIPAIAFQADNTAQNAGMGLDTIQPGTDFVVRITDGIASGYTFSFAAYATALR
jgi:hypothetical protein